MYLQKLKGYPVVSFSTKCFWCTYPDVIGTATGNVILKPELQATTRVFVVENGKRLYLDFVEVELSPNNKIWKKVRNHDLNESNEVTGIFFRDKKGILVEPQVYSAISAGESVVASGFGAPSPEPGNSQPQLVRVGNDKKQLTAKSFIIPAIATATTVLGMKFLLKNSWKTSVTYGVVVAGLLSLGVLMSKK